ncbi:MAG: leucine-rich repeat domain-containing protein [Candidatus Heimdallarchaeota archaeon]|nr:MAG: leucine-rich repeat domain-containing protein [Candidatus Heimdallarchaeota archaeon]
MKLTTDNIVQKIMYQTNFSREEVLLQIKNLAKSLKYRKEEGKVVVDEDPTIPKLLAQEWNVDLGDPSDYLYTELIFDNWPLFARIIPLTTVTKDKIVKILKTIGPELEAQLQRKSRKTYGLEKHHPFGKILLWQKIVGDDVFVRDGILFYLRPYVGSYDDDAIDDSLVSYTFEDIITQAELYRTFTDYKVVKTADPQKTYIPYSLFEKIYITPPEWMDPDERNRHGCVKFPYITLEAGTPGVDTLFFVNSATKEIVGIEALQDHPTIRTICIVDGHNTLEKLDFPPDLSLPNLEHLEILYTSLRHSLDISFIQNCPNLSTIMLEILPYSLSQSSTHELIIPPLVNHQNLEQISISGGFKSIILTPPWHCPNLQELYLTHNSLKTIDLRPLENCPSLQVFMLDDFQAKTFNLEPFRHCPDLEKLSLYDSQIEELDLSPLKHCLNLRRLFLSHNHLKNIDFSPLKTHPSLEKVYLSGNQLETFDLSPLIDCPNLRLVDLTKNPLTNQPSLMLTHFYQKDLEIIL